ncbi:MAG: universal stress protein [Rhodospirillaceae bacterium]|nr:universal stress protein [Rhodospirillaceae bacterium]MBT5941340.1 universal stress protein [Rhodospirillaceae bacterium]MBT7267696.1 universal stress protein [Rhodospirillaceae bacterium]
MFEKILVPVDGSVHANKAIDLAAELAVKFKAKVVMLHVLLNHASVSELMELCERLNAPDDLIAKLKEIEDILINTATVAYGPVPVVVPVNILEEVGYLVADNAKKLAEAEGVDDVDVHVRDGAPADLILAAADHENADVIVMGSRGLGHLTGMLMGSVSHKVNHLAECTCITVK